MNFTDLPGHRRYILISSRFYDLPISKQIFVSKLVSKSYLNANLLISNISPANQGDKGHMKPQYCMLRVDFWINHIVNEIFKRLIHKKLFLLSPSYDLLSFCRKVGQYLKK